MTKKQKKSKPAGLKKKSTKKGPKSQAKTKAKKKAKAYPRAKVKKGKKGVGEIARECIMKAMTFESTLKEVKKTHPDTHFSKKCYYWYRSDIKQKARIAGKEKDLPKATK